MTARLRKRAGRSRPTCPGRRGVLVNPALTTLFGAVGTVAAVLAVLLPVIRSQAAW